MKKILTTTFSIIMLLIVVGVVVVPQQAEASWWCVFLGPGLCTANFIAAEFMIGIFAAIGNAVLQMSAWFLSIAGVVLNISIVLTMNIKAIYEATPAIEQVWIVIRNISSIFIIFGLLYTSIMTILDMGKNNIKELVGKIVMAGLLINFSLFFTRVLIDASNLASLSIYRAIVPVSSQTLIDKNSISGILSASFGSGGLSDVFMSNLKIPKIYNKDKNKNGLLTNTEGGAYFKIAVSTFAGSALMIIAALSFFAAAIAFIIRLVLLLLLLGFSPVYFVGMIFPEIKGSVSDKWFNWLKQQLIFMPVYLLFMYVALRFISTINPAGAKEGFFAALDAAQANAGATATSGGILLSAVGIIIQYTIALILINIPLIAAAQTGGISMGWGMTAKKWVGDKLKVESGRVASRVAQSTTMQRFAGSSFVGEGIRKGLIGVAGEYDKRLSQRVANREATYNSLTDSQARTNYSGRLTNSIFTRSGNYSMATTGRADRVGAARILSRRQTEITAEINRMLARRKQLDEIIAGNNNVQPRALSYVEQQEYNAIGTVDNPGADLRRENDNLLEIRRQIAQFQMASGGSETTPGTATTPPVVTGGATPSQVNRRNY